MCMALPIYGATGTNRCLVFVTDATVEHSPIRLLCGTGGNAGNDAHDRHLRQFSRLNICDIFATHNSAFLNCIGARS